ncbi:MAG: hypothetical protein L0Y50_12720 [Beijerinckiaceae bacterium]|nr:hypothetical protein [Beijerinckiaceae bacterium]MCI0737111.1 hypothetical protein [Beijerinckiaceae bacterium]
MKSKLLIISLAVALAAQGSITSLAGGDVPAGGYSIGQADACQTSCKTNADFCRQQCEHPDEPEQCIVACSTKECNASCKKFEDACTQRCQGSKG